MKRKGFIVIFAILTLVALIAFLLLNSIQKAKMTYEEKVVAFAEENSSLKKGQIVFIGDSITAGYNLTYNYHRLDRECYNRGISGDTTDWLLSRLQVSLFDLEPSTVVLMIGTNDINGDKSVEQISDSYATILELFSLHLPDAQVICVSIIPQNKKYSNNAIENNKRITATLEIERLAREMGYEYVNLYDNLTDDDGLLTKKYSKDGLHLNRRGYRVWTNLMKDFID